jgi:PAS domain S-box-containing protein
MSKVHEVPMKNPFSLRSEMAIKKRVFLLLLIVFVPFLLLEVHVFYNWFQKRKGMEMQANLELARAVAINFETFLQGLIRDELALGLALTGSQPLSDKDRDRILDALAADNPAIRGIFLMNPAGVVIASSLRSYIGFNLADRSFFQNVAEGQDWAVSELIVGRATGKPAFTVSRAIRADGTLLGVVAASIEPDRLSSLLGVHRSKDAGLSLVDSKGMHVSRFPPTEYTWEQRNWLKLYPILEESLKGREITAAVTSGVTGKRRLVAFVPVSSVGWVAASSRAEDDVTAAIFQILMPQIGLTLLLTLIAAIAAVGLSRPITRSIFKMKRHAEELGRGETEHIVPEGPQELKALAHTLNEMAQKVLSREAAIRESESLYRAIAENFPEGAIYIFDHDLRFRVADGKAMKALGYRKEELEGKTIWEATDAETCHYLEQRYPRVLAGESLHFETQLKGRIFSSSYVPIRDAHGSITAGMVVSHDITERKRAEEALRENEARYRELVQNANSAILHWRADGTITFFNEYAQVFFGWSAEEVIGKHVGILVPEQESSGADLTGLVRDIVENPEKYVNNVNENVCRDGRRVWMTWTNRPVRDEQGRVTGILAVGSDITALRESEAKYRDLFNNMTEEVHFWEVVRDESGQIKTWRLVDVNPPALKTWGRNSVEEIRGKITDEIFGPGATEHYLPVVNKIMSEGVPHAFEDYFPHLDKYFRFTSVPLGDHFITTGADITVIKKIEKALRRSEARWNAAIESFAEGAIIATEDEQVIYWNPAAREMHGFTRPDEGIEPLEKTPVTFQLWSPDGSHMLELDEWPMRRIKRGETVRNLELRIRRPDQGWEKIFSYSGAMVETAGGERLIFLSCSDLTELRRTEQTLKNSLSEKEVLLKEIHHRVKNNMQVISSLVDLQADEVKDPAMRGIFQDVIYRVRSMAMVHEKLYQSADLAQVDFADYAQSLLGYLWHAQGAANGIQLALEIESIFLPVNAAVPCGLILNELFSNALKHAFIGRDSGRVTVSLNRTPMGRVCLGVRDDGTGMPPEIEWKKARSLGLRLVQMLAGQLDAVIEVVNSKGTEVMITFEVTGP